MIKGCALLHMKTPRPIRDPETINVSQGTKQLLLSCSDTSWQQTEKVFSHIRVFTSDSSRGFQPEHNNHGAPSSLAAQNTKQNLLIYKHRWHFRTREAKIQEISASKISRFIVLRIGLSWVVEKIAAKANQLAA